MRPVSLLVSAALVLAAVAAPVRADNAGGRANSLLSQLQRLAPEADPQVLALALESAECASASGTIPAPRRLAVIDYSRPSTERRLWVFDLASPRVLYSEYVAHGRASGENLPTAFSNLDSSHQSSLGLFATAEVYTGHNGVSMRMDGLEPGFNDKSEERAIVMHSAAYADPRVVPGLGRLGRSQGCPAVRPAVAARLINTLKRGSYVFAYYPQPKWLETSRFLAPQSCAVARAARTPEVIASLLK